SPTSQDARSRRTALASSAPAEEQPRRPRNTRQCSYGFQVSRAHTRTLAACSLGVAFCVKCDSQAATAPEQTCRLKPFARLRERPRRRPRAPPAPGGNFLRLALRERLLGARVAGRGSTWGIRRRSASRSDVRLDPVPPEQLGDGL